MTRMLLLATLLGVGCAAKTTDRAALAPTDAVAIAPDITVTCAAPQRDHFAYDPAVSSDAPTCGRDVDEHPQLELDAKASAQERARAVTAFLTD